MLPVTFVIIALAFTGVYAHQQTMHDFVAERDLALARLTARMVEDGLAHGVVGIDGGGLAIWTSQMVGDQVGIVLVVDGSLLVLTFGWRTIVQPLQALSQAAGQVSWGDYSAIRRSTGGVQEVQDLHLALAEMVERIQGYEAGMQDYLGAVTQGQEAERARLAQELHDGPVQDLVALGQQAEMVRRLVKRGETERAQELYEKTLIDLSLSLNLSRV